MITNRCAQTLRPPGTPLAMLDFVARPQHLTASSPIGRHGRWKALSFPLVLLCALGPAAIGCKKQLRTPSPRGPKCGRSAGLNRARWTRHGRSWSRFRHRQKIAISACAPGKLYANPFLVVHPQTITLTIIYRDQDPNAFSGGGFLWPGQGAEAGNRRAARRFAPGIGRPLS